MKFFPSLIHCRSDTCVIEFELFQTFVRKMAGSLLYRGMQTISSMDFRAALRQVYGYNRFRPYQEEIVRAILNRQDAFVVMPTGGGKSLCYQLPAHLLPGTCLVISPLISLMKDQVDAAKENGLRAEFLNSSLNPAERERVARRLTHGELDLLYVSPERFKMTTFQQMAQDCPICFVAIDEAHCISEWGHDFRPDYLELAACRELLPDTPIAAFTATATLQVQQDIICKLRLQDPLRIRASFNRPNLFYRVIPKHNADQQILDFIRAHPGQQGIVYRTTRADVEDTALTLKSAGIPALPYHAGMEDEERTAHQEAFNRDEIEVIVATIAFGMGIDKSNVRYVVHGDLPKNIEGYYQETGRAGRDGEPAECLLLYSQGDMSRIRYFIGKMKSPEMRQHALLCMQEMARYGAAKDCRRKRLLGYFGEQYRESNCGACDYCAARQRQPLQRLARECWQPLQQRIAASSSGLAPITADDQPLYAELKRLRKRMADEQRVPPFVIFSDRTLREMATCRPETFAGLGTIHGVGSYKLEHYGAPFIDAIQDYVDREREEVAL